MLFLVASILLNEAMDNYIDRQKKEGGNHSLSLAYVRVRATILELRKKVDSWQLTVDKQRVSRIEEQMKWIQPNPAVPLNGKRLVSDQTAIVWIFLFLINLTTVFISRAGVFTAF